MKISLKIIFPVLIFLLVSCKKDHSVLGVDVQPSADDLNAQYLNDLPVTAHSLPYDSVASYNDSYKFIGSNEDPYFGRTDIGLYLNPSMIEGKLDFGDTSVIQSAEIILAVDGFEFAGDTSAHLTYSVYAIENALNTSEIYFTSDTRHHNHNSTPISVYTGGYSIADNGEPIIRIKLDNAYALGLLHDTPNLVSNEVFQAKYKGYYITTNLQTGSQGIIYKANLADDLSGLYLHYKTGSAASDTITNCRFSFIGSSTSKYNTLKFSPTKALQDQFRDSTFGATNLYLKGMGMSKMKIQIPFLKNYSDTFKVAVNRAELVLNIDPASLTGLGYYAPPPKLTLLSIDSLSRETYIKDILSTTDYSRYDGNYDAANKRYVFNIAREAQLIFEGKKKNNGFYLVVANSDISLLTIYSGASKELLPVRRDNYYERVVFAGTDNIQLKPRFNLNYIRFKKD